MKRVLIITYYWPPSGGAGVQRWLKFVKYLPGFEVEPCVLTVDPLYASYPLIDRDLENDIPAGVKVFKTRSHDPLRLASSLLGRDKIPYAGFSNVNKRTPFNAILRFIRGNFFIPDARKGWNKYAVARGIEIIQKYNIDVVITTGPPHSTHLAGLKLKNKLDIRWIADFRDPWTDIYYYSDMLHTPIARYIDRKKEKLVIGNADQIIAINNSVKDLLISKQLIDSRKISVITNGYDEDDFTLKKAESSKDFILMYSGTISENYKPEILFKSLFRIMEKFPEINFRFRLAGNLSPGVRMAIKKYRIERIFDYCGYLSHKKLTELLPDSTVLIYMFPGTKRYTGSSGKLFEYLATGKPVISIDSPGSDASAIIEECEAGKTFNYEDEEGLYNYLIFLCREFITSGKLHTGNGKHNKYTRKNLTADLARLISALS